MIGRAGRIILFILLGLAAGRGTVNGLSTTAELTVTCTIAPASKAVWYTEPAVSITAGLTWPAFAVQIQDADGNPIQSSADWDIAVDGIAVTSDGSIPFDGAVLHNEFTDFESAAVTWDSTISYKKAETIKVGISSNGKLTSPGDITVNRLIHQVVGSRLAIIHGITNCIIN